MIEQNINIFQIDQSSLTTQRMSREQQQYIEVSEAQLAQIKLKKNQIKYIKPVIEDDRHKTKPNYVPQNVSHSVKTKEQTESQKNNQNKTKDKYQKKQHKQQKQQPIKQHYYQKRQNKSYKADNQPERQFQQREKKQQRQLKQQPIPQNHQKEQIPQNNQQQRHHPIQVRQHQNPNNNKKEAIHQQRDQTRSNPNQNHDNNYRVQYQRQNYFIEQKYPPFQNADNYIYVGAKTQLKELYPELKEKLKSYDFVAIKATGTQVVRAIELAQEISKQYKNLKRINIPGTVFLQTKFIPKDTKNGLKQYSKTTKKASITIELSLNKLDIRHMGYQQNRKQNPDYNRQKRKVNRNNRKPVIEGRIEENTQKRNDGKLLESEDRRDNPPRKQYTDKKDTIEKRVYRQKKDTNNQRTTNQRIDLNEKRVYNNQQRADNYQRKEVTSNYQRSRKNEQYDQRDFR